MQNSPERIVSDLEIIESPNGVPVDFNYNETIREPGFLTSAPGCPKSIDRYPWVYFGNPPRCHLAGYSGPCGDDRYLFIEQSYPFGVCVCQCFKFFLQSNQSDSIQTSPSGRYKFCGYNTGYDSQEKICYDLNERGPCALGQWLVRNSSNSLICITECPIVAGIRLYYNHNTDQCEKPVYGGGGAGASPSYIARNRCQAGEHYSSILKDCVPKNPTNTFVLG
ncbi:unnamed protein product [Orchesella dallaii]|uniref:DUF4789 domain-containing protein n=1 Tax=Orchesella dallaii TaxID=48710 RepID=A0ABP1Q6R5_9HEXA